MDMQEVQNTIEELESMDTTFDTCMKLASLYIVREHYKSPLQPTVMKASENVRQELSDILPAYKKYCSIKRKYQLHELTEGAVIQSIQLVCQEIDEFMRTLWSSTDMPQEREALMQMIQRLQTLI